MRKYSNKEAPTLSVRASYIRAHANSIPMGIGGFQGYSSWSYYAFELSLDLAEKITKYISESMMMKS